jgi:hypothetical protein
VPLVRVRVAARPDPHRLRAAIEDALTGRPASAGPETAVGAAVASALRAAGVPAPPAAAVPEGNSPAGDGPAETGVVPCR